MYVQLKLMGVQDMFNMHMTMRDEGSDDGQGTMLYTTEALEDNHVLMDICSNLSAEKGVINVGAVKHMVYLDPYVSLLRH
jgi:hypothetical protein